MSWRRRFINWPNTRRTTLKSGRKMSCHFKVNRASTVAGGKKTQQSHGNSHRNNNSRAQEVSTIYRLLRWIQLNLKHPENIKMAERVGNELSNATRMQMKSGPSWFSVAGTHVILPAPTFIVTVEMLLQMFRLALPTAVGKAVGRELLMFVYSHVIGKWQLIDCHWVWSWSW